MPNCLLNLLYKYFFKYTLYFKNYKLFICIKVKLKLNNDYNTFTLKN